MLTTGPAPAQSHTSMESGRGLGSARSGDFRGAERIRALREIPPREEQRDGFAHFQTRRSGYK
jgi:hypothetical protein